MPLLTTLLGQLEDSQLLQRLEEAETSYQFQHSLTRESAYGSLLRKQRRDLHRRVAECYERLYPTRLEEFAVQLAYHLDEAGEPRAWKYYRMAGDAAFRLYANPEAIAHYERAIALTVADDVDLVDLLHLFLRRGRAMELLGQFEAALNNYVALEQAGRTQGEETLALAGLVEQCQLRATPNALFDANEAERLAAQALALAARLDDKAAEARIRWGLVNVGRFAVGRQRQAREHGDRALALARQLGLRELESFILNDVADIYMMAGLTQRGRQSLTEASVIFRELGNLPMLADSLASISGYEFFVGHDEQAVALSDEAFALSQSIGNIWGQSYSRLLIGYVYWDWGEPQRAIELTETAIRQAREVGFAGASISNALLSIIFTDLGAYDRARQAIEQGLQITRGAMEGFALALLTAQAQLSIERGDLAAAEETVATLQSTEQTLNPFMVIFYRSTLARLTLAHGRFDAALAHTDDDLAALKSLEIGRTRAEILLLKAQALIGLEHWGEAKLILLDAIADAEQARYRRLLWRLRAELARVEASEGRASEAAAQLAQARAHIAFILGNLSDPDLAASFRHRPDVQAVMGS